MDRASAAEQPARAAEHQPAPAGADETFSIAASVSLQQQRFLTLKNGDTFGVFDQSGNVRPNAGGTEGLYFRDTRYLSRFELLLSESWPMLLSSTLRDDNGTLTCDLSNPDLLQDGKKLDHDMIHLRRSRFLWQGVCYERIALRNFALEPHRLRLEVRFDADFVDLFEVRGTSRTRHGARHPAAIEDDGVVLSYTGLDQQRRATRLRFDPQPTVLEAGRAVFDLELQPRRRTLVFIEIACDQQLTARAPRETFLLRMVEARRWLRTSSAQAAAIATSNEVFNEAVRRSISDLYMLVTDKPTGLYPYAGVPWFSAAFGRDALITALQTLWLDPKIALGVLNYLAIHQATEEDPLADAEPGKILHEVRHGEMAQLREVPFRRYYGSVDSTPLFIMLAGAYIERTHDDGEAERLWPHVEAALGWLDTYGDRDGDGFIEYFRKTKEGLANQGWKDSWDSVFHADGTLATGPIALCEVQGYAYAARRAAAAIAWRLGKGVEAERLSAQAQKLQAAFEAQFWCEELGTYALALDGDKRPCRVRASNAGHLLLTAIASPERAARVVEGLMSSRFFSGWGVRTLASTEARYNPMAYHNGSVWPHDNALIALGLARYGFKQETARILNGLFDASEYIDLRRLPELFCGFARRRGQGPTFYPVACSPQAWSATALVATLQACLGIGFDPSNRTVLFDRPTLPACLEEVTLHNLTIGEGRISVLLRRMGREVAMNVTERHGEIHALLKS